MANLQEYKCPSCGGALSFDSTAQEMKCPYCDTQFTVESLLAYDKDLAAASDEDKIAWETSGKIWQEGDTEGMRVYTCKSCGGQIIGDENTGATSCPYCGNPVVLMGQFKGDLKPDYIIPFKLDKEAAKKALLNHYKDKPFIPKSFITDNHINEIKGLYVPFWLFDTESQGSARYKGTKIRTWRDADYRYTETSFYSILRQGGVQFENIPFDGSSQMPDDLMESIEPFDFSQAVDFQTAYMAGYLADRYDVGIEDSRDRVNARVKRSTEQALASTVSGYTTVTTEDSSVNAEHGKVKYAMYPVWILNTQWEGKNYTFAMNGQTGKFVGDIPIDNKRANSKMFSLAGIIGGIIFVAGLIGKFAGLF